MFNPLYFIKLEKRNAEEEIKYIILLGGIEHLKSKKNITNKALTKYDNQGGLICNIGIIKKEKEEEKQKLIQQKEAEQQKYNILHSVTNENKYDNNNTNNNNSLFLF